MDEQIKLMTKELKKFDRLHPSKRESEEQKLVPTQNPQVCD